ncbi:L-threonine dehydrogenase [Citrobacter freundii complex sp. CFNIH11]|nr:L-threonine dehydrogenase [Citrobacter freundii complex sp. CFNIH11]
MQNTFFMPPVNMMGAGCLSRAVQQIRDYDIHKCLIVTDSFLNKSAMMGRLKVLLNRHDVDTVVFDGVLSNPTTSNVREGLAILLHHHCDGVISFGGGSPHDCAKAIALLATNGGEVKDYEGINCSEREQLPLFTINTTAGTASEMTRFCIITDEQRKIKMAIIDKNVTPLMSVNDPELMLEMPAFLTAATGMDALTHAIEAYMSTAAFAVTDGLALKAINLIYNNLRTVVFQGDNLAARENMAIAQFMAGMAFNSASLGYVHAIAHQLGGFYNLAHGVCNAILLPYVQQFNAGLPSAAQRLIDIARAMDIDLTSSDTRNVDLVLTAIKKLSSDIGIPGGLADLGVKAQDFDILAENTLADSCSLTNPRPATHRQIKEILAAAM